MIEKIIWAVDPFEGQRPAVLQALKVLVERFSDSKVFPVYILGSEPVVMPPYLVDADETEMRRAVLKEFSAATKDSPVPLEPLTIVSHKSFSITQSVKELASFADSFHARLIVVGTHGRKGLSRFLIGSFAETLILNSHLPVLIIGPGTHSTKCQNFLFPTDLAASVNEWVYKTILAVAHQCRAHLIILHVIGKTATAVREAYLNHVQQRAAPLLQQAAEKGVDSSLLMKEADGSIAEEILAASLEQGADVIVMAAQSGAIASAIAGSVTRQTVRVAPCPVLVLRVKE